MDWQMVNNENNINCIVVIKNVVVDVFYEISKKMITLCFYIANRICGLYPNVLLNIYAIKHDRI